MIEMKRLGLEHKAQVMDFNKLCFPLDPWEEAAWDELLSDERALYYALLDDEKLVAAIFLYNWQGEKDYLKIMELSVHPQYRKQGLARRLLQVAADDASKFGLCKICGETRQSNLPMQSAFASCGYTLNSVEEDYYDSPKESAYKYVLTL